MRGRMLLTLHVIVMSSAFFNPSFAFSSHFDTDGAPLSELSWPSSLAVVAVSFAGLFAVIFLMLACLCCKKGDIGFKEFDNAEGKEYQADLSPSCHNGPEVYILPLSEVSKQADGTIQHLKSSDLDRHSLLYLKEIGNGWFGKVLLGEVNAGLSTTRVVVKELKASASVWDQMQFLEEVQPYRTLQHAALLQCLAQCSEVTPHLLLMEFCPLGDLKSYLRSCRLSDSDSPDPLVLQRMARDVASGLLHLHDNDFIHSDLALRNCQLTSEMSVKIGDYGLGHSLFKEDYYVTQDQIWVPLRWMAPELIDQVHGNVLVVDQTKASNIWSLGVTVWELFELGDQPYRWYSDRQVLMYAVREQQLRLPKPQLNFSLAERWYEVMQFCWLQPDLRPRSEEVHLLLTHLCAKGSSEAGEDFQKRRNALRPKLLGTPSPVAAPAPLDLTAPSRAEELASSSFPLLGRFSESFHSDAGDDLLTVTETSHGLNFEYKWDQAQAEQPHCSSSTGGLLGQVNPHSQDVHYSSEASASGGCRPEASPPYNEPEHAGVVPVLSARSPLVHSDYYIRIEDTAEYRIHVDDNPALKAGGARSSPQIQTASTAAQPNAYRSTAAGLRSIASDCGSGSAVQPTAEPLLRQASGPAMFGHSHRDSSSFRATPSDSEHANICDPLASSENKQSQTRATSGVSSGLCDPYLTDGSRCRTTMGPVGQTRLVVGPDVKRGAGPLGGHRRSGDSDEPTFPAEEATSWTSNHSANNNTPHHNNATEVWSLTKDTTKTFRSCRTFQEETERGQSPWSAANKLKDRDSRAGPQENNLANPSQSARGNETPQLLQNGERFHSRPNIRPDATYVESPSSFKESHSWIQTPEKPRANNREADLTPVSVLTCLSFNGSRELTSGLGLRDSGASLVELADYSEEDDDFADITSSIFTDFNLDYGDMQEEELSPLKNPEGTPDSADTTKLSWSMASTCNGAFSPDSLSTPAQPKSLDSGYDTENNGSPDFIFNELLGPQTSASGLIVQVGAQQNLGGTSEVHYKYIIDKNTYRDSAYFSDYDTEIDKSPKEEGAKFFANPSKCHLDGGKLSSSRDPVKSEELNQKPSYILARASEPSSPHSFCTPAMSTLSPLPVQMGGCLTKEAAADHDQLDLDREYQEQPCSELSSSVDLGASPVKETSTNDQDGGDGSQDCCHGQILCTNSTAFDRRDEQPKEKQSADQSMEEEELPEFMEALADRGMNEEDFEDIDAEECDSQDSSCQASYEASFEASAAPFDALRAPLEEAEDDSDDSESDEELRTYSIQEEDGGGSHEDLSAVPVVVSDSRGARHLRSLLKTPTLLTQSLCEELERKKKRVSFFDDVTVFLFDQESPTGDLVDDNFSIEDGYSGNGTKDDVISNLDENMSNVDENKLEACEETDGDRAEHALKWEGNVALEPCQRWPDTAALASPSNEVAKSVALDRFLASSRFSITQVSGEPKEGP
ncbi:serine/threonine-protein kinase LMTK1 isoform X2 [Syngnathus scovelli]|uniref:serine/threonine-protein kinase LMTK1 isoform X2 n=1 Tax=Syngnathus scovelli TaxID=161590 RepID=UPI002110D4BC|nr:serine/threonine-protein kinase LMTK1 isoform X2 [Syngnathus scovelli]